MIFAVAACAQPTPVQRAIDYLIREVPRWSAENQCFSCHNNGDAARALYVATRQHRKVPTEALADTTRWLIQPANWDSNRGNPAFSDKKLARIQFAASLAEASRAGAVLEKRVLIEAAESLLPDQAADGSWQVDAEAAVGSPATWGTALATYMARGTLERADARRFSKVIAKADRWLANLEPASTLDAAVKLLAAPSSKGPLAEILRAQTSDGGWGPHLHAPAEPFDTAAVLLALKASGGSLEAIGRGTAYLVATQQASGGWPETTRPPGGHSYAQHISTSGWATLALLAVNERE